MDAPHAAADDASGAVALDDEAVAEYVAAALAPFLADPPARLAPGHAPFDLEGFLALERGRGDASDAQHIAHKAVFDATVEALLAELAPKPSLLGLRRSPRPAAEAAAAAATRVRAWAAERCDEDVDALLLEAAEQDEVEWRVTPEDVASMRECVADELWDDVLADTDVVARINIAAQMAGRPPARLVAVSKTKPVEALREAYDAGQKVLGENYVQELLDKASQLPDDIQWHFIGHLQSNKAKALIEGVPNLAMVETVDSMKLANKLDAAVGGSGRPPLPVLVQVNTSGEESKYGVAPGEATALARHVAGECSHLRLAGLMTIGQPDYSSRPENFECLRRCRGDVAAVLSLREDDLELSMGMSGDFEQAVEMGSSSVRIGSTIFGARDYSKAS
ncbi:hypothetical protein WJX81_000672 [Elliptochloris bilobata]|uniref:Pyridoxal phosphate homeostasis protein n=1 Tax=Elliptochloris bilobata TaxID=381761 RepID=A0AAW1SJ74_9CHLO